MLHNIILTIDILVCIALVIVILLQRSEGGALGMGSGPSGFMTARGAGNLLTRATAVLATMFFVLSSGLTILGNFERSKTSLVDRNQIQAIALAPAKTAPAAAKPGAAATTAGPTLSDLTGPAPAAKTPAPAVTVTPATAAPAKPATPAK